MYLKNNICVWTYIHKYRERNSWISCETGFFLHPQTQVEDVSTTSPSGTGDSYSPTDAWDWEAWEYPLGFQDKEWTEEEWQAYMLAAVGCCDADWEPEMKPWTVIGNQR